MSLAPTHLRVTVCQIPKVTLHLNGTSGNELMEQHRRVKVAAEELVLMLQAAWPHSRDYTPAGYAAAVEACRDQVRCAEVISSHALRCMESLSDQLSL